MKTYLCLNSWAGRSEHLVKILGATPKRYKVQLLERSPKGEVGKILHVPKTAIKRVSS